MPYDPYKPPGSQGVQSWNVEGRLLGSTVEPLPTLKNPGRYWIQNEDNEWSEVDPRDYEESEPRLSELTRAYRKLKSLDPDSSVREGEYVIAPPGTSTYDPETGREISRLSDIINRGIMGYPSR